VRLTDGIQVRQVLLPSWRQSFNYQLAAAAAAAQLGGNSKKCGEKESGSQSSPTSSFQFVFPSFYLVPIRMRLAALMNTRMILL